MPTSEQLAARRAWIAALLSGEYLQGNGSLIQFHHDATSFCCLGVACDVENVRRFEKGYLFSDEEDPYEAEPNRNWWAVTYGVKSDQANAMSFILAYLNDKGPDAEGRVGHYGQWDLAILRPHSFTELAGIATLLFLACDLTA